MDRHRRSRPRDVRLFVDELLRRPVGRIDAPGPASKAWRQDVPHGAVPILVVSTSAHAHRKTGVLPNAKHIKQELREVVLRNSTEPSAKSGEHGLRDYRLGR